MSAIVTENNLKIVTRDNGTVAQNKRTAKMYNKVRGLEGDILRAATSHPDFTGEVTVHVNGIDKSILVEFGTIIADTSHRRKGHHILRFGVTHTEGRFEISVSTPSIYDGLISMIIGHNGTQSLSYSEDKSTFSVDKMVNLFAESITTLHDVGTIPGHFVSSLMTGLENKTREIATQDA